jgi:iron complex transport system substrate-binding protein
MVDAILRAAGLRNATRTPGFEAVSLERLALDPPKAVVLGFFDTFQLAGDSWGPGRHRVVRDLVAERGVARLPGSTLGCPDASAAEAVELLAAQAPR